MSISLRKAFGLYERLSILSRAMRGDPRSAHYSRRFKALGTEHDATRIARAEAKRQRRRDRNLRIAAAGGIGVVG